MAPPGTVVIEQPARMDLRMTSPPTEPASADARLDEDASRNVDFSGFADRLLTPLWVFDVDRARVVAANTAAIALWRASSLEDLRGRDLGADMSASVRDRLRQFQADLERSGARFSEMWTLYPGGEPTTLRISISPHRLADGRMAMLCEVLSEIHDTPERLRSAEALLHTPVMITLYDLDGQALYRNPAARRSTSRDRETLAERFVETDAHRTLLGELSRHASATKVARIGTVEGIRWHEVSVHDCWDAVNGEPARLVSETDVTAHKEAEARVRFLAHHDMLTGLPNRALLMDEVARRLEAAAAAGERIGLMFIDLDRFKTINDSLGHTHGDLLLREVAWRLTRAVRAEDFVARLGGDEFFVCLALGRGGRRSAPVARRILLALDEPVDVGGRVLTVSASLGLSTFPDDGHDLDTLMRHADLAMYAAKEQGRGRWVGFTAALKAEAEAQMELESSLRKALERHEFELYYQPRLSIAGNRIVGAEALLRWHHPTRGMVLPGAFIPFAEMTGLIDRIGADVLRAAAAQQRAWSEAGHDISVSVNLSARQFRDPHLKATIADIVATTGCDPARLQIEITESMLVGDDATTAETLRALAALGFSIAIDDFGTGYSNLTTIQRHPIDTLKIDQSFIATLETQPALAELIIGMCHLLDLKTIAEGVETAEQLAWLKARNCHEYQGYLFSPAIPAAAFGDLLDVQRAATSPSEAGESSSPLWDLIPMVVRPDDVAWQAGETVPLKVRRLVRRTGEFGRPLKPSE